MNRKRTVWHCAAYPDWPGDCLVPAVQHRGISKAYQSHNDRGLMPTRNRIN